jgi:hypothetical protein
MSVTIGVRQKRAATRQGRFDLQARPHSGIVVGCTIGRPEKVVAVVYDLFGHAVATLVNRQLSPGEYRFGWDTRAVAPGCYTIQLREGADAWQKTVMVTR